MPKKKRRRPVSPHSGIVIDPPRGRHGYRARWIDPLSGKEKRITFDVERYPNDFARRKWAEQRSAELKIARLDKREGVVTITLADAIDRYIASCKRNKRARTLKDYERIAGIFRDWATERGIRFAREISAPRLEEFREARVMIGRAPNTVNIELRAVATMVRSFRRLGWVDTSREQIAEALRQEPVPTHEIQFLKPIECRTLLQRAIEHDQDLFKLTRKEKRKGLPPTTARYPAIAPFLAFVMCTGVRFGEALSLTWGDVDLDDSGGFVRLAAGSTKTKRARRYLLKFAPLLRELLRSMHLAASVRAIDRSYEVRERRVFEGHTIDTIYSAQKRMRHGKPRAASATASSQSLFKLAKAGLATRPFEWSWQALRRTAATALCGMPSAGPWVESRMLGHSVTVSESRYADLMRTNAETIEAALEIEQQVAKVREALLRTG